jgi:estrogen-related receptor beta like 1
LFRTELRPLTRTYFALPAKPTEQFPYYSGLINWLLKSLNIDFLEWNEFDDPNTISTSIVEQLRNLKYSGDISASKIRTGSGEAVCCSLDFLCDQLLSAKRFRVVPPTYGENEPEDTLQGKTTKNKTIASFVILLIHSFFKRGSSNLITNKRTVI